MSSGVVWTGINGLCLACKNFLNPITKGKEDKLVVQHHECGCVNDGKKFVLVYPKMSEEGHVEINILCDKWYPNDGNYAPHFGEQCIITWELGNGVPRKPLFFSEAIYTENGKFHLADGRNAGKVSHFMIPSDPLK